MIIFHSQMQELMGSDVVMEAFDSFNRRGGRASTLARFLRRGEKVSMEVQATLNDGTRHSSARYSDGASVNLAALQNRLSHQEEFFASIMDGICDKCHKELKHMELTDLFKHKLVHKNESFAFDPEVP